MDKNQDLLVCALQNRIAQMEEIIAAMRVASHDRVMRILQMNHTIAELRTQKLLLESQVRVESLLNLPDEDPYAGSEWTGGKQT
jgi:hypothetical protein